MNTNATKSTGRIHYLKYAAIIIVVVALFATLWAVSGQAANEYSTSTNERYSQEWSQTWSEYPALRKKLAKANSFIVPGLEKTHIRMYESASEQLEDTDCGYMVPQGITVVDNYIILTAYCFVDHHPSVLYILDKSNGNYITTISLYEKGGSPVCELDGDSFADCEKCINHVGGIAYDGSSRIYIAKSLDRNVSVISKDRLLSAIAQARAGNVDGFAMSFDDVVDCNYRASYLTCYNGMLFVGVFGENVPNALHGFTISGEPGALTATEQISYSVAYNSNGACFYQSHGRECLAVTSSHGRKKDSQLVLYEVSGNTSSATTIKKIDTLTLPPLAEEMTIDGGLMYTVFESGATAYSDPDKGDGKGVCSHIVDRVCVANAEDIFYWAAYEAFHADDDTASTAGAKQDSSTIYFNLENLVDTYKDVTGYYNKDGSTSSLATGFVYSDSMLLCDSTACGNEGYTDLAKAGASLSAAAYSSDKIKTLLSGMSYEKVNQYNYGVTSTYTDNDRVAFSVAQKAVFKEGERYVLYVVPIRGSYGAEWYSDFNLGRGGTHEGFNLAYDQVIDILEKDFFASDGADSSHRKIFITGHSRGAAVANLLAGKLTEGSYIDQSGVFAYTIACPAVSMSASISYKNIYNYNYEGDVVPTLPLESWGYERYGTTINYSMNANSRRRFQEVSGQEFAGDPQVPVYVLDLLQQIITSREAYFDDDNQMLVDILAFVMKKDGTLAEWELIKLKNGWKQLDDIFFDMIEPPHVTALEWLKSLIGKNDAWVELSNEISAGRSEWLNEYKDKDKYGDTVEERWSHWKADYSALLQKISEKLYITINEEEDLDEALESVNRMKRLYSIKPIAQFADLIGLIAASDGKPKDALAHGHIPETYVSAINSKYFGYEGWKNSPFVLAAANDPSITSIGQGCFQNCSVMEDVLLSEDLKVIGASGFSGCAALEKIVIPDSVQTINSLAFNNCTGLTKVTMPISAGYDCEAVWNSSYRGSFCGCSNVREIHFTTGSGEVMRYADHYHGSASSAYQYGLPYIARAKLTTVSFEDSIVEIPEDFLRDCNNVENVDLPDTLQTVGTYAFSGCSSLAGIEIPAGITEIPEYCFNSCSSLAELALPDTLTEIADHAFYGCSGLPELVIPDSVETIDIYAFYNCTGLTKVTMPISAGYDCEAVWNSSYRGSFCGCSNVREIHFTVGSGEVMRYADHYHGSASSAYQYGLPYIARAKLTTVSFEDGIPEIPEDFLHGCTGVAGIIIPSSVKTIGAYAFSGCSSLTGIEIPSSVQTLGAYAFSNCSSLAGIEIPSSITKIPDGCFRFCSSLAELMLPDTLTEIGDSAFRECRALQELVIPDSVETIDIYVFYNCTGLTKVTMPISAGYDCEAVWNSSYRGSFCGCSNVREIHFTTGSGEVMRYADHYHGSASLAYQYGLPYIARAKLTTVSFEDSIVEIPEDFLRDCNNVENVDLPDTLQTVGTYAFSGCSSLAGIEIPAGITEIPEYCFNSCSSLAELILPDTLTEIADHAFYGCSGLPELMIPDSVETIDIYAFYNCTGLTKVTMPISAGYDCEAVWNSSYRGSFCGCSNVREIHFTTGSGEVMRYADHYHGSASSAYQYGLPYIARAKLTTVTFEDGITEIPEDFLHGCTGVDGIIIPSSVKTIGAYAFSGCSSLTGIEIPSSVQTLGAYAFSNCSSLAGIEIPSSITKIPDGCFRSCSSLAELMLPDTLTEIGDSAFRECRALPELVIPDSVETINSLAFNNCSGLTKVTMPISAGYDCEAVASANYRGSFSGCSNVREIHFTTGSGEVMRYADHYHGSASLAYQYGLPYIAREKLTTVTFEDGITEIPEDFLRACGKVENVDLPDTLQTIGTYAFSGCSSLAGIEIPAGITEIPEYCFNSCSSLAELALPDTLTEIADHAFYGCSGLPELVIPDSVQTIDIYAFYNCTGLTKVTMPISAGYDCEAVASANYRGSFCGCSNVREIHFTVGSGEVMRYADHYHGSASSAYQYGLPYIARQNLTTVTFEDGITEIPEDFLRDCSKVENVDFPDTLQTIGTYAFYNCKLGPEMELPESLETIGSNALNCSTLTDLLIPADTMQIGASAVRSQVTIYGERGSEANTYADNNGNTFIPIYEPVITVENTTMNAGGSQQLTAAVQTGIHSYSEQVNWYLEECSSDDTSIDASGLLSLALDETGPVTVGASYRDHHAYAVIEVIPVRSLADCVITLGQTEYDYDGTAKEPDVTVTYGDELLTEDQDYIVTYENNTNPGEASVTILPAADSAYVGSQTVTFLITGKIPSEALNQLLEEIKICDQIALSDLAFTLESYTAFTRALEEAKAVAANEEANDEDYQAAYDALVEAKEGLVIKTDCDHVWGEGEVVKAATCLETGIMRYTCTLCGGIKTEIIQPTGHAPGEPVYIWSEDFAKVTAQVLCENDPAHILEKETVDTEMEVTDSTCTEEGNIRYTAVFTKDAFETQVKDVATDPLGHAAEESVIENDKPATCTEDGSYDEVTYCAVCGAELSRETVTIPASGHVHGAPVIENEILPTDEEDGSSEEVVYCTICGAELSREIITLPKVDKTNLYAAIDAAVTASSGIKVSKDGTDVEPSAQWVTQSVLDTLQSALDAANAVADNKYAPQSEVDASEQILNTACEIFNAEKKAGTKPSVVPVSKIVLNRTKAELATKTTLKLKVTFTPSDTTQTGITWTSSDPEIATVDSNGKVTAKTRGKVTITATSKSNSKVKATCVITVKYNDAYYNLDGTGDSNVTKEMETAINWAADNRITGEKVSFGTMNSMSRGQFVRFLHRYAGEPKVTSAMIKKYGSEFTDVDKNYTHYKAIVWAVSQGLIGGYSDGTFKPEGTLTRNNVATILWKYAGSPKVSNPNKPFSDVTKSTAIAWGKNKGIFTGTKFMPKENCLRGDFALFLYRYDKVK